MSNQINESKITYRKVGDYLIPNLTLPAEERSITLGKWGMMHKDYLKNHKQVQFNIMLTKGKLYQYLADRLCLLQTGYRYPQVCHRKSF